MALKLKTIIASSGETHALGNFSILVGPNNCGKSQTLRDIRDYIIRGTNAGLTVLRDLTIEPPPETEAKSRLRFAPHPSPGHVHVRGVAPDLKSMYEFAPREDWFTRQFAAATDSPQALAELLRMMGKYFVAHLDAESRFLLSNPTESYDTRTETATNALQAFFARRNEALPELRTAFKDAFNMDIALDWAGMRKFSLRVNRDFGAIPDTLTGLDDLLDGKPDLAQQGDGYRSFAGVALAMLTFPDRLLLLDEPEAFLHPAQARALGRWLAQYSAKRSAQIVLATHSADFLWGAVSANSDTSVIRLNRAENNTSFHVVPSSTVSSLAQSPLLSSQPVLDALFQRGVCICEGDPDRAVYQTVAHSGAAQRGGEILFIHANGKDAMHIPVTLLRDAGTPVCAIVDIDVLNSPSTFRNLSGALGCPDTDKFLPALETIAALVEKTPQESLLNNLRMAVVKWQADNHTDVRRARRALVAAAKAASKWDAVKKQGVDFFNGGERSTVEALVTACKAYGLFIVPKGELEGWMKLGLTKGRTWNRAALEKMHSGGCPPELRTFVDEVVQFLETAPIPADRPATSE